VKVLEAMVDGRIRRCDSRCHNAKGKKCACLCQGIYHGAIWRGGLNALLVEHQKALIEDIEKRGYLIQAVQTLF
jgi:hypothetical protein